MQLQITFHLYGSILPAKGLLVLTQAVFQLKIEFTYLMKPLSNQSFEVYLNCFIKPSIQQFEEKACETQEAIQKLINTIDDHKNNFHSLFSKIKKEIIYQYGYSIETLNSIQNSQFNQQIQKIITFSDFEKALNLIMVECIQEFEDKVNKLIKNIKFISGNNYHFDELFEKGYYYFESKDYMKALNQFDQALNSDQNHRESLAYKGRSLKFFQLEPPFLLQIGLTNLSITSHIKLLKSFNKLH